MFSEIFGRPSTRKVRFVKTCFQEFGSMFSDMSGTGSYEGPGDVPFSVILPAFITSELKTAFQIGFFLVGPPLESILGFPG